MQCFGLDEASVTQLDYIINEFNYVKLNDELVKFLPSYKHQFTWLNCPTSVIHQR